MFESRISAGELKNFHYSENFRISSWSYDMVGHAKKCVERYCELANKTTQQLYKVSTPCIDDHHFKEDEMKSVGELSKVGSQIVLKCLYLARIGILDILWPVNKLARSITKWTRACDKRLNRLISYIHHTCEYKQYCYVGNTAYGAGWDCFETPILREILKTQNQHQEVSCVFSDCFSPWKKTQNHDRTEKPVVCLDKNHVRHQSRGVINVLDNVDLAPSNVRFLHQEALLYVFEDSEAVIKMILKGRSPTMRHVSRTHRVALDWCDEWNRLLCLFHISHFSSAECSEVMSKRTQKESGEERVTAKSRPMMSLIARSSERALSSTASESPGKTRHESQRPLSAQAEMYDRTGKPVVCRETRHERHRLVEKAHSSSYS